MENEALETKIFDRFNIVWERKRHQENFGKYQWKYLTAVIRERMKTKTHKASKMLMSYWAPERKEGNFFDEIMAEKRPSVMKVALCKTPIQQTPDRQTAGQQSHQGVATVKLLKTEYTRWKIHTSSPEP